MNYLWNYLNINENFDYKKVDDIYYKIKDKNENTYLAWKILRDPYYSYVYKKYKDINKVISAGFFDDNIKNYKDIYELNFLSTPYNKILDHIANTKNPVVLLSTGGFTPIHNGHLAMMEEAKKILNENNYDVVGGYFSLEPDCYMINKPNFDSNIEQRLYEARQTINDSNWLMIDPWYGYYNNYKLNFTNIIERLELYLQKYIDKRIKVAYVFGGDNVDFMYCFEQKGIGVCLSRTNTENFIKVKNNIRTNHTFFLEKNKYKDCSSRYLRNNQKMFISHHTEPYMIRNEHIKPLIHLNKYTNNLEKIQQDFLKEFVILLNQYINNTKIIDINEQIKYLTNIMPSNTISLDSFVSADINLEASRLFEINDLQIKTDKMFIKNIDILNIINKSDHQYTLIDDDSISGTTLNYIQSKIPNKIKDIILLSNYNNEKPYDIIDLRDFILGSNHGGLMVRLNNNMNIRVPYVLPFVSLFTRASIPIDKEIEFSINIWKLNLKFYSLFDTDIYVKHLSSDFQKLMAFIGYSPNEKIIDICKDYISFLSKNK